MSDFGEELTRRMQAPKVGVRELARRTGYSHGHISDLRSGRKHPSPEAAQDLDDALKAGGALMALVNRRQVLTGAAAIAAAPLLGTLDAERLRMGAQTPAAHRRRRRAIPGRRAGRPAAGRGLRRPPRGDETCPRAARRDRGPRPACTRTAAPGARRGGAAMGTVRRIPPPRRRQLPG